MDKVLYIIGAGFSAPLGLPVMGDFLYKSKDLYFQDLAKFEFFKGVFDKVESLGKAKTYIDCDLLNIEEILSILEMKSYVAGQDEAELFTRYIAGVVSHYTPKVECRFMDGWGYPSNWPSELFGTNLMAQYGLFTASLLNLRVQMQQVGHDPHKGPKHAFSLFPPVAKTEYGVISLNYDMVIEKHVQHVNALTASSELQVRIISKRESGVEVHSAPNCLSLAKIHGTLEPLAIVPPTWNKVASGKVRGGGSCSGANQQRQFHSILGILAASLRQLSQIPARDGH